jgi:hypothetical protein
MFRTLRATRWRPHAVAYHPVVTALGCLDLHAAARLILRNRLRKLSRPQLNA